MSKKTQYTIELAIGPAVERLPIIVRKHSRSRRMVIRYQQLQHHVSLTLPRYVSIKQGLRFVEEKRAWLERQIRSAARPIPFEDGEVIPFGGERHTLKHIGGRGVVTMDTHCILVPGDPAFMARRVREWLKAQAQDRISGLAQEKVAQLGEAGLRVRLKKISLRDTSSRWGSCSHDGRLSFSWRLVLAPPNVLDYVVCHEVAHLKEHNHSQAFWDIVALLCPAHEKSRQWLRLHGAGLYSYG